MTQYRILLADDDSGLRALMARRLSKIESELDQAENGKEALALLESNKYDLVVSDIYMPGATGLDILRAAREKDPHLQVVVVTAAATLENAIEALNNGAFGYMIKPFDHISVFDNTVRRALEFRRLMLENKRMAEAQKRRGDMLEDEVTDRIQQVQKKGRDLMDILSCLPNGVLVVDDQARVSLSNPEAEKLLAREAKQSEQPFQQFVDQSQDPYSESKRQITIGGEEYQCARYELPERNEKTRQLILIQPVLRTSSLPTNELWEPLEKALEIAEWLKEKSHSGRQEAAIDRMTGELVGVAQALLEIDPGLRESSQELERNALEIPPEIEAQLNQGDDTEHEKPMADPSLSAASKPNSTGNDLKGVDPDRLQNAEHSGMEQSSASSSQEWPPSPPSEDVEIQAEIDGD
jgi:DNA-binding response OmpR family regulator